MHIKAKIKKVFFSNDSFLAGTFLPESDKDFEPKILATSHNGEYKFSGQHMLGTGNLEKSNVVLHGEWENDPKFGWGMKCSSVELIIKDDLHHFLVNFIHGIGEKKSRKLLADFGSDRLVDMIENRPHELTAIKGIGAKLKTKIIASWERFKSVKELSSLLLPAGCTPGMVQRICRHFGTDGDLVKNIKSNPYLLTEVTGISFKAADSIALHLGFPEDSSLRVRAAILHSLDYCSMMTGDTVHTKDRLMDVLHRDLLIMIGFNQWLEYVDRLVSEKVVVRLENGSLSLKSHYDAELFIYNFIKRRSAIKCKPVLVESEMKHLISNLENSQGFHYNQEQRNAIECANNSMFSLIAGSAGTGKTTCSKGVLEVIGRGCSPKEICVTALSGVATDRIRKATGYNGATIQSLLVRTDASSVFEYKVLGIDEGSMIPSVQMAALLKRVPDDCRVVLIGDWFQLDPVGPGSTFTDLIKHSSVNVTKLTKPNRQSETSQIISVANDIRQGKYPADLNVKDGDFKFIEHFIPNYRALKSKLPESELFNLRNGLYETIRETISDVYKKWEPRLKELYSSGNHMGYLYSLQLITPIKKGLLGVYELNKMIQSVLNYQSDRIECFGGELGVGDKVVHLKNQDMPSMSIDEFLYRKTDYDPNTKERIFNGFIGVVLAIDFEDEIVWVNYPTDDRVVIYDFDQVKDVLQLGYSLTVHKSQGAEFNHIVLPVCNSFYRMLTSRLMYTSITRGQKSVLMVGDPSSLQIAVRNRDISNRSTVLQQLFKKSKNGGLNVK